MKVTRHDPPIVKTITFQRKWWQFWKSKQWDENHEYGEVWDFEGKSVREGFEDWYSHKSYEVFGGDSLGHGLFTRIMGICRLCDRVFPLEDPNINIYPWTSGSFRDRQEAIDCMEKHIEQEHEK